MSMSITPASELDLSLITFAGSDSTLTRQGGDKKREEGKRCVCGRGEGSNYGGDKSRDGYYSRKYGTYEL